LHLGNQFCPFCKVSASYPPSLPPPPPLSRSLSFSLALSLSLERECEGPRNFLVGNPGLQAKRDAAAKPRNWMCVTPLNWMCNPRVSPNNAALPLLGVRRSASAKGRATPLASEGFADAASGTVLAQGSAGCRELSIQSQYNNRKNGTRPYRSCTGEEERLVTLSPGRGLGWRVGLLRTPVRPLACCFPLQPTKILYSKQICRPESSKTSGTRN
jgi:hypothetical protein